MPTTQTKVIWLSGNMHERKLVLDKIKNELSGAEIQYFDDSVSFAYLEKQILCGSCFSEKRIFIIRELPTHPGTKATYVSHFKKLMDIIPDDSLLVFNGIEPDDEKALSAYVKKIGKVISSDLLIHKNDAANWLVGEFSKKGKSITNEDAQKMVDLVGFDQVLNGIGIDILKIAVTKICSYVGKKKSISAEEILVNSFPSEEFVIWGIFDALDSKNLENCMNILYQFFQDSQDQGDETAALNKLLFIVSARYKCLFYLKEAKSRGLSLSEIEKDIAQLNRMKQTGIGFNSRVMAEVAESTGQPTRLFADFTIQKDLKGIWGKSPTIDTYSRKELVRILRCIEDSFAEIRLRGITNMRLMMAEVLMFTICSTIDDNQLDKIRNSDQL